MRLVLDLGTSCGWAAAAPSPGEHESIFSGTWDLSPKRFEGGGMRFVRFRKYLNELHALMGITHVYFEEVRAHKGVDAAHVYGGLMGHLTEWCEGLKIPYAGVPVQRIKKFATGKGNATKEAVMRGVEALGFRPSTFDQSDALALLHLMLQDGV